jgi:hypothetical protein
MKCQNRANLLAVGGDSGGPVFVYDNILFERHPRGIQWAGTWNTSNNTGISEGSREATFEGFLSELILDTLPYSLDCSHMFSYLDYSYAVYDKYQPENGLPYAKFQTDTAYALILYTFPGEQHLPFLYSYDLNGNIIDSIGLFIGKCRNDFDSIRHDHVIINEDLSIILTDTIQTYSVVGNNRTLNSSTAEHRHYILNEFGKFELVETNTIPLSTEN